MNTEAVQDNSMQIPNNQQTNQMTNGINGTGDQNQYIYSNLLQ